MITICLRGRLKTGVHDRQIAAHAWQRPIYVIGRGRALDAWVRLGSVDHIFESVHPFDGCP